MLLQDGTDAGAHWPTRNFYSVSLHTEKSRYLNYFKWKKLKKNLSIISKKCESGCSEWISLNKAGPCWWHCGAEKRKTEPKCQRGMCDSFSQQVSLFSKLTVGPPSLLYTHTHIHSSLVHLLLCIQMASEHPFF